MKKKYEEEKLAKNYVYSPVYICNDDAHSEQKTVENIQ